MKEQTLDELWKSLDKKARAELLGLAADHLFVGCWAFDAWRRGTRPIPKDKQPKLANIIERKYSVKLKTA